MKTIIKYELVINEALISALNYHTPDEQINEFIRFFGRHIGLSEPICLPKKRINSLICSSGVW